MIAGKQIFMSSNGLLLCPCLEEKFGPYNILAVADTGMHINKEIGIKQG